MERHFEFLPEFSSPFCMATPKQSQVAITLYIHHLPSSRIASHRVTSHRNPHQLVPPTPPPAPQISMLRSLRRGAMRTAAAATATAAAVEATTHLPTEGRSSRFYHDLSDRAALPLARRLLGPEVAHELSVEAARLGWAPRRRPVGGSEWRVRMASSPLGGGGPNFPNPIGLAAGFDKDGVAIRGLMDMGFGSVELGSVTPLPQPGNPKPRLFRLTEDRAVINRYGFNSKGLDAVEENLRAFRRMDGALQIQGESESEGEGESDGGGSAAAAAALEVAGWIWAAAGAALAGGDGDGDGDTPVGVLGVNLGKNKTSDDEVADYCRGIRQLGPYADYLVVNISSPNTPGLRGLQRREPLLRLLGAALSERDALSTVAAGSKHVPLLVKIAPDVTDRELEDIAAVVAEVGVDGVVVSNTSTSRPASLRSEHRGEAGGLSGAPIRDMSTECIRRFYRLTGGNVPIVGVGGVGSGQDAYEKLRAGASLVQLYSMMVYEGPGLVSRVRGELADLMVQNGQKSVEDVVGIDHEDIYWAKREARMKHQTVSERMFVEE